MSEQEQQVDTKGCISATFGCLIVCGFFALIIWGAVSVFKSCTSKETSETKHAKVEKAEKVKVDEGDVHGAWSYATLFVERELKSPRSAKYPFAAASNGAVTYLGNDTYLVKSYVDSENSFGAMIRTNFTLTIKEDKATNKWILETPVEFY